MALAVHTFSRAGMAAGPHDTPKKPTEHDAPLPPGDAPRPLPAYSGRPARTSASQVAWWIPRVALFPLYVVSEYAVRRPVGALVTLAEKHHLRQRWYEFFTLDDAGTVGLFPTGQIDLGLRPRAGLYFVWLDALGQSDLKLHVTTGGLEAWAVNALLLEPLRSHEELRWTFDYSRRPDGVFYGLGHHVQDRAARYREQRFHGRVSYRWHQGQLSFSANVGLLSATFDGSHEELGDESLEQAIAKGIVTAPPALAGGILAFYSGLAARVDTRPPRPPPAARSVQELALRSGSGVSAEVHASHYGGLQGTRATVEERLRFPQWLRYGTSLAGAVDLTGTERTLQLETSVELVEPLPVDNPIPFTEQVSLGGAHPLRAFAGGRLIDQSAAVATLSYSWPIWPVLDGNLHYSIGNVFDRHFKGFQPDDLRSSFGIGMASVGSFDHPFEMLIAFGTKPLREGGSIETFRFVVGTRAGF
ncbi:MAG TPA: hypothetical protein VHP33_04695 [Polyangiaceae bacterium]|nr:hypothetical protein [Polyangiaceae bacterium]